MRLAETARVIKALQVVARTIDDELLLVPIGSSSPSEKNDKISIVLLNKTAAAVWQALDGKRTAAQIASLLVERFLVDERTARDDTLSCLDDFLEIGLVKEAGRQ
ncbi:MAG: hypothetical protein DRI34_09210 [Deltaproteobacteria bacterium]|nr:MAG: hypothetical protein DRI34_09210 [Deltaproteobacteria bacterium]